MCCWEKPVQALPRAPDNLALLLSWIYEEAYCLSATTRNLDAVQMKIVLPHIAKWQETHESIELSNEMREMCYRNYERVIPFSMSNVSACKGRIARCNRHLYGLSRSRKNIFDPRQQNGVTKLTTTSWTPNFFFWEIFNRVIKPQTFESHVWWVPTLKVNVETS